jgi:hypothetical protein
MESALIVNGSLWVQYGVVQVGVNMIDGGVKKESVSFFRIIRFVFGCVLYVFDACWKWWKMH